MMTPFIIGGVLAVLIIAGAAVYIAAAGDDGESELHEETRASLDEDEIANADFDQDLDDET